MPTPEYVLALRERIGHDPISLVGVTAVVLRGDEVLLGRRADNGSLAPITGIVDPGEEPAEAARREAEEEAGVEVIVERLAYVHQLPRVVHGNGDQVDYLDLVFRCRWVSGEPWPADGEMSEVFWRHVDELDGLGADGGRASADLAERIRLAARPDGEAVFLS